MAEPRLWLRQAEADLKAGHDSLAAGHEEWACYQAEQSAAKALRAFLYVQGLTSIVTRSLRGLAKQCVRFGEEFDSIRGDAKYLENFNIPTRYPIGLAPDTAPADYFDREDAEKCLSSATSILSVVKKSWPK